MFVVSNMLVVLPGPCASPPMVCPCTAGAAGATGAQHESVHRTAKAGSAGGCPANETLGMSKTKGSR